MWIFLKHGYSLACYLDCFLFFPSVSFHEDKTCTVFSLWRFLLPSHPRRDKWCPACTIWRNTWLLFGISVSDFSYDFLVASFSSFFKLLKDISLIKKLGMAFVSVMGLFHSFSLLLFPILWNNSIKSTLIRHQDVIPFFLRNNVC